LVDAALSELPVNVSPADGGHDTTIDESDAMEEGSEEDFEFGEADEVLGGIEFEEETELNLEE
jgi:hypothetical protein